MNRPEQALTVIALGSNLGDSAQIIVRAMDRLEAFSDEHLLRSSLWRSDPVDCPPGSPAFVNAVVGLIPQRGETPETLLLKTQALEREFGRQPKRVLNEARPLDLDLITYGGLIRNTERLILPHARAHLRRFVLEPLAEIAPNLCLPGRTKTVRELLADLGSPQSVVRL